MLEQVKQLMIDSAREVFSSMRVVENPKNVLNDVAKATIERKECL